MNNDITNEQMILNNLGLIHLCIKQLNLNWKTEDEFQNYYDSGLIGLIKGVESFKLNKDIKLSTFLIPCIKNEIKHHLHAKTSQKRLNKYGKDISSNKLIGDVKDTELSEFIKDVKVNIEKEVETKIQIETIISKINEMKNIKDALVLKMYFGINGFTERNFKEISDVLKVSPQRIRQRFHRGLKDLKEMMRSEINE